MPQKSKDTDLINMEYLSFTIIHPDSETSDSGAETNKWISTILFLPVLTHFQVYGKMKDHPDIRHKIKKVEKASDKAFILIQVRQAMSYARTASWSIGTQIGSSWGDFFEFQWIQDGR